jgi:hypothetical protein
LNSHIKEQRLLIRLSYHLTTTPYAGRKGQKRVRHITQRKLAEHLKSLPNQLGIHLFLAKQEKLCSNSFSPLHAHICALSASAHRSRIQLRVHI